MEFRALLETLKFLDAKEVLIADSVSRLFHSAASSEELWTFLLLSRSSGLLPPSTLHSPSKSLYQQLYSSPFIPTIVHANLCKYYLATNSTEVVALTVTDLTRASYLLFLPDMSIFACGGDRNSTSFYDFGLTTVYRIFPITHETQRLSDMTERRRYPCSYYYAGSVYVFGGADNTQMLNSAEQYQFRTGEWTILPRMNSRRCSTTPCMYGKEIYLVGGYPSSDAETFNVETRKFAALSIRLLGTADCVAAVVGQQLIVFTMKKVTSYTLPECNQQTQQVEIPSDNYVWSHSRPQVYKGSIWFYYWHRESMACFTLSNAKFQLLKCCSYDEIATYKPRT